MTILSSNRKAVLKVSTALSVLALLLWLARRYHAQESLTGVLAWVGRLGPLGPLAFVLIYIAACVLFVPGSLLTLGAGVVFGVVRGSIYVSIGATLGATAAFLVGRYLARGWVSRQIEGNPKFKAVDEGVAREGWKIVLLTRLSPAFPFALLNYGYGLTRVSLKHYLLASWAGMLPGTIMFVYVGSLAGDLTAASAGGGRARSPAEWVLYGIGLAATVAVTLYVTRIARKALERKP